MQSFSSSIADWLVQSKIITKHDHDLFDYAVYSLLWGLTPVLLALILGLLSGMLYESIFLITPIILLRKFSGGYHLESAKHCMILSTTILALALGAVRIITIIKCNELLTIMVFFAIISICFNSPIDSDARRLTKKEKVIFKKLARIVSIFTLLIYTFLLMSGWSTSCSAWGVGIVVVALLQVPSICAKIA